MPLYFAAADVTVMASHAEGCPNVVLESLACGRPVVASAVGEAPRMIEPDKNGLLFSAGNVEALGAALTKALSRPWSAETIRTSGAVCSWESVAERTLGVFRAVLARPSSPVAPRAGSPSVSKGSKTSATSRR